MRNENTSIRAQFCEGTSESDKISLEKMVSVRTYESNSKIDTLGTKSTNNKIKIKFKNDVMILYYGLGTKMNADITDGNTIMTTCVGSGIDLVVTIQYRGSIENDKGVSENVEIVNPENIVRIRRDKTDILSKKSITRRLYLMGCHPRSTDTGGA